MKLIILMFTIILATSTVLSQDQYSIDTTTYTVKAKHQAPNDNVKIGVSFTNFTDKLKLNDIFPTSSEDFQGVSGTLNFKLFRTSHLKLSGDAEYTRAYIQDDKVNQLVVGPKLSYLFDEDKFEVFGSARYGYTEGNGITKTFTKSYGFGGDVNIGNFYIRPLQVDFQYLEGYQDKLVKLSSGIGFKF